MVIANKWPTTLIRGTAPLKRALKPSSFTMVERQLPMLLYRSLPPASCSRVFTTSIGVTEPEAMAPARPPASMLDTNELLPSLSAKSALKFAYPGKNKRENGTWREEINREWKWR